METPPSVLERLLSRLLPREHGETVLGDLREEYGEQARIRFPGTAPLWYLGAGLSVALHYALADVGSLRGVEGDVRLAVRRLARAPGFTALAVGGIALAVGANALTLSLAHGVFLAPPPFPEAGRVGLVTYDFTGSESDGFGLSYRDLVELRGGATTLERVAAVLDWVYVDLVDGGQARRLSASFVGPGYLELLGAEAVRGRTFNADENRPGAGAPVVLLSRAFWMQEMGGSPDVVGRTVQLNGGPATVVGVLAAERYDLRQRFGTTADVYLPLFSAEGILGQGLTEDRGSGPLNALVRLRPGATFPEAREEMGRISRRLAATFPESNEGWSLHLERLSDVFYADLRLPVGILLSGAFLVFLLVTFNLAGLVLVRALSRRHEAAVRRLLGAAPGRLLRPSLMESVLVAGGGGVVGLLLAQAGSDLLGSSALLSLPTFAPLRLTGGAVFVTGAFLVTLAGVLTVAGWVPAGLGSSSRGLRSGARHTAGRGARRARRVLVVGEVAFAFALLLVAGLLVRSFTSLRSTDMGFDTERLLTLKLDLRGERYAPPDARRAMARRLVDAAGGVAGVEEAFLWSPNGIGEGSWVDLLTREGRWNLHPAERLEASRHHVLPGTMEKAGIRILRGRGFREGDDAESPQVALVSESLARRLWPGEEAVGKAVESPPGGEMRVRRVVGVVEDARHRSRLADPLGPQLDVYYPFDQWPQTRLSVAIRLKAGADRSAVTAVLRERVAEVDARLPLFDVATMAQRMREEEARWRLMTLMVVGYATLAAVLASLGIYGVLAETVRERTREIGVRFALGARAPDVVARVVLGALEAMIPGALLGAALVAGAGGVLQDVLYGVGRWDPAAASAAALLLLGVGVVASALPALRAAAVDPVEALREG